MQDHLIARATKSPRRIQSLERSAQGKWNVGSRPFVLASGGWSDVQGFGGDDANRDEQVDDGGFGDGFAELRHDDGNEAWNLMGVISFIFATGGAKRRRCCGRLGDDPTKDLDDREGCSLALSAAAGRPAGRSLPWPRARSLPP